MPNDSRRAQLGRALLLLAFGSTGATAQHPGAYERWFVASMAGTPVGWVRERSTSEPGGIAATETELRLVLNRLGSRVEMTIAAEQREREGGSLVSVRSRAKMSKQEMRTRAIVEGRRLLVDDDTTDQRPPRAIPFEGELWGPERVRGLTLTALSRAGDTLTYQTFMAELGGVTTVVRRFVAVEEIAVAGRQVRARRIEEKTAALPAVAIWLDDDGRMVQMEQAGPFGLTRYAVAEESTARAAAGGGELPEESYGSTVVRTGYRLPRAREISALTLELRHREPALGWPALDAPTQRVTERSPDRLTLTITRPRAPRGARFPVPVTEATRPYLEPNSYVQSDDPQLAALARSIIGGERDLFQAALALERWVSDSMHFDPGIVFARSSEVLRDRRGTCIAYATLLTALTRAVGIPSRFAMGYVYVDGMFGGHAWTEVLVGKDWIPIDAAQPGYDVADAARIGFAWTSLAEGQGAVLGPGTQLYGKLDARVVAYAVAGESARTVPAGAKPYLIDGDVYRNAGLDLSLAKPNEFSFGALDDVWPSRTIVQMRGPGGARVTLERRPRDPWDDPDARAASDVEAQVPGGNRGIRRIGRRAAQLSVTPAVAALAVGVGSDVMILIAEGENAPALLERVASTLRLP